MTEIEQPPAPTGPPSAASPTPDQQAGLDKQAVLDGIDRAALVLAVLAGAVAVVSGDGDWGPMNVFEGLLLLAILLGFHQPMPRALTVRVCLMRLAFGLAVSFGLCVGLGWPVVKAGGDVYHPGWVAGFVALGVVLAALEPRVASVLDRRLR